MPVWLQTISHHSSYSKYTFDLPYSRSGTLQSSVGCFLGGSNSFHASGEKMFLLQCFHMSIRWRIIYCFCFVQKKIFQFHIRDHVYRTVLCKYYNCLISVTEVFTFLNENTGGDDKGRFLCSKISWLRMRNWRISSHHYTFVFRRTDPHIYYITANSTHLRGAFTPNLFKLGKG